MLTFSPPAVSGLIAWYDFSDASTLFTDTGRTTAVSADGNAIKGVTDKSGTGHHLSEATNGPAYKLNIKNALSVSRFDGTNDILKTAAFGSTAQPFTVFAVTDWASATGTPFDGLDVNTVRHFRLDANTISTFAGARLDCLGTASADIEDWQAWAHTFNGASSKIWESGTERASGNVGTAAITGFTLGDHGGGGGFFGGDFAEFLVYNAALSDASRDAVETYLGTKWGITVA